MTNLAEAVRRAAERDPGASALICPAQPPGAGDQGEAAARVLSWGDVDAKVDAAASGLLALDLPATARIAIALPNVTEFAETLFGVMRAGLVAVPLNPGYTARELRHQLADSGASVIVATQEVLATVAGIRDQLPALRYAYAVGEERTVGESPGGAMGGGKAGAALETLPFDRLAAAGTVSARGGGEDLAVLLYTSGTGGAPKGAMLSHRALIANHLQLDRLQPSIVRPDDVVLLALPLFHAFGLNSGLGAVAWHGACGVLVDRFDPVVSLDIIARHEVTVVAAVPQMYVAWSEQPRLAERLATVRLAVSGAAPLDLPAARRMQEVGGLPVFEGYGLTETAPVVATALASPTPKSGSIGRPIPDVEIKLVSSDGSEIARVGASGLVDGALDDFDDVAGGVPGTDPGEIVVRGPNLFSGYWPGGDGGPDAEGWWATADIAYADADGDLFLVDRVDELILVSGFNVYPYEVEQVLGGYPGVVEAAVVGVPHRHTGQAVKAYVVLGDGGTASAADLLAHCKRNLAPFKCPAEIVFVRELPHSATGKVRKGLLEKQGRGS